jgi:hypothetical protein
MTVSSPTSTHSVRMHWPHGPPMPPVRRLTAILAADVAGYSRLMSADEEGTHERLKAHLAELVVISAVARSLQRRMLQVWRDLHSRTQGAQSASFKPLGPC